MCVRMHNYVCVNVYVHMSKNECVLVHIHVYDVVSCKHTHMHIHTISILQILY